MKLSFNSLTLLLLLLSLNQSTYSRITPPTPHVYSDISFKEKSFSRAHELIEVADARYISLRDMFIRHLGQDSSFAASQYTLDLLDEIVAQHVNAHSFAEYQKNLKTMIADLQQARSLIEREVAGLKYITTGLNLPQNEYCIKLADFICIEKALSKRVKKLQALSDFLQFHYSYFQLIDLYSSTWYAYNDFLLLLPHARTNDYSYESLMSLINTGSNSKYPFASFYDRLQQDIPVLTKALQDTKVNYQPLCSYTQALLKDLRLLAHFVHENSTYRQETRTQATDTLKTQHAQLKKKVLDLYAQQRVNDRVAIQNELEIQALINEKMLEIKQLEMQRELLRQQAPLLHG